MIDFYEDVNNIHVYLKLDKIVSIEINRYGTAIIYTSNNKSYKVSKNAGENIIKILKGE